MLNVAQSENKHFRAHIIIIIMLVCPLYLHVNNCASHWKYILYVD